MAQLIKWSDENLILAVKESNNIAEILRKLGYNNLYAGNYKTIRKHIKRLKLNTEHFTNISKKEKRKNKKIILSEILIQNSTYASNTDLKIRLIKENLLNNICSECNIFEWNNKSLVLQLDHINGDNCDNRIENLRLLCPNCHSQTYTFSRGTRLPIFGPQKSNCIDCNKNISKNLKRCDSCKVKNLKTRKNNSNKPKIEWPSYFELKKITNELGFIAAANLLGVSDNAIRKHMKYIELEKDGRDKRIILLKNNLIEPDSFTILNEEEANNILLKGELIDSFKEKEEWQILNNEYKLGLIKSKPGIINFKFSNCNRYRVVSMSLHVEKFVRNNIKYFYENIKEICKLHIFGLDEGLFIVELEKEK